MQVTHVDFRSRSIVSSPVAYAINYLTGEVATAKKAKPSLESAMEALSRETGLCFDGGDDDRLFCEDQIRVFAHLMSKKAYTAMEKDMNGYSVKGQGFEVYAWNDCSGYAYWKKQGEADDSNYIQVTAKITDPSMVNAPELETAMAEAFSYFEAYDNLADYQDAPKPKAKRVSKPRAKKGAANV